MPWKEKGEGVELGVEGKWPQCTCKSLGQPLAGEQRLEGVQSWADMAHIASPVTDRDFLRLNRGPLP